MHDSREGVTGCHVDIGSVAYVLDDLAKVDQIGRIANVWDNRCHAAAGVYGGTGDGNVRIIGRKHAIIPRIAYEPAVVLCAPNDSAFLVNASSQLPNHRTYPH